MSLPMSIFILETEQYQDRFCIVLMLLAITRCGVKEFGLYSFVFRVVFDIGLARSCF
uniref:Uncharacterized protein n=1 Tax=Rhizophora mucronata TaxID=61149 RepID=A0A2P2IJY9_RHIMU